MVCCRGFNHYAGEYRNRLRCACCGENHQTVDYSVTKSQFNVNCGKSHGAACGGCSVYKEAREVKTVAVTKRVSLTDTRSIVLSYAGAVTGDPTAPVVVSQPSISLQ